MSIISGTFEVIILVLLLQGNLVLMIVFLIIILSVDIERLASLTDPFLLSDTKELAFLDLVLHVDVEKLISPSNLTIGQRGTGELAFSFDPFFLRSGILHLFNLVLGGKVANLDFKSLV